MEWFNIGFTVFMLLSPAVFMSAVSFNRMADTDWRRARRLMVWLWVATGAALAVSLGVHLFVSEWLAQFAWVLFFVLFFGFWGPLMRAKNPDWVSTPPPDLARRSASLAMRQRRPAVPEWAVWSMWVLWLCAVAAVVLMLDFGILASTDPELRSRRIMGITVLVATIGIGLIPALSTFALRRMWTEPEPLDPHRSQELIALYAQRSRQRAWFFIAGSWAMLLLFGVSYSGIALISRGALREVEAGVMIGWFGGIGGSAIGITGAVFGIMSSVQQARINGKLRELSEQPA